MSTLKEFQAQHGAEWGHLLGTPAFGAALALANQEKIQSILMLDDDEISTRATVILADLRGHLRYEAALIALHEKKELVFQQLDHEEYPDPIEEAREQAEQEGHEPAQSHFGPSASFSGPSAHDQIFPPPKRRGRPPKKKSVAKKSKPRKIRK